jgi:hypothetical protein
MSRPLKYQNLLEFSQSSTEYWRRINPSLGFKRLIETIPSSNLEFEHRVIDYIAIKGKSAEKNLLAQFFYNNGKLEDVDYFYSNINKIASTSTYSDAHEEIIYNFCRNSIKCRLPLDIEEKFFDNLWSSYYGTKTGYKYAKYVVRGRLPENYEKGCNNFNYLNFIIKKGEDITNILINSSSMSYLYYMENGYLPEAVHNFMVAMCISKDEFATKYFKQRKKDDKFLRGRLKTYDSSKTVSEILKNL